MGGKELHFNIQIFIFSSFSCCFITQAQELPQIVKKIIPSTVVVITYDRGGEIVGQGSGFFIDSKGDIITNGHVLEDAYRAEVKTADGKVYPVTQIVGENREADLIRASVSISGAVVPLTISQAVPEVGEKVAVIGNPLGLEHTVSDGIVSAVREIPGFGRIYQITAAVSSGSSGSPAINMKGEVIGVVTFQFVGGQNLNFVVPSEHIAGLKAVKGKVFGTGTEDEKSPAFAEEHYWKGLVFLWIDDYEPALSYFEKAVK